MNERRLETISFKVTKKELEILNQVCDSLQVSKSDFIRNLIHKELCE